MLKVNSVKILSRGTTASGFEGVVVGETDEEQYRACFCHAETTLKAAGLASIGSSPWWCF